MPVLRNKEPEGQLRGCPQGCPNLDMQSWGVQCTSLSWRGSPCSPTKEGGTAAESLADSMDFSSPDSELIHHLLAFQPTGYWLDPGSRDWDVLGRAADTHHVTSVKPINVPLSSSMFPFCKWRIRNSLQPIKCALFYKMLFSPLVVDIYSSPINEQINSTIFSGCRIVLHVKDTLFFSEKQNRQQTTEGTFSTIPKDQTFCYE